MQGVMSALGRPAHSGHGRGYGGERMSLQQNSEVNGPGSLLLRVELHGLLGYSQASAVLSFLSPSLSAYRTSINEFLRHF